jgi:arylsulfatase A-like enzyme
MKKAGYTTGVVGKWHLGLGESEPNFNQMIAPGPKETGYDESFIIPATGDRTPCVFVENGRVVGLDPKDPITVSYGQPIGDEPTGLKNPDLLSMKPSHGHDNTIINGISRIGYMSGGKTARWKDEDISDVITSKAVKFIEANRAKPFFLYFAAHDVHVPRVPHPRFRGTSQHGTRGDVIQELDASVGKLLDTLDSLDLTSNTLVIFTSDNGGVMDDGYIDGSGDDKSGHRCNGVLKGFKGGLYEGGTRVPFIAKWPGRVPAGKDSASLICHIDMMATVSAITGVPIPTGQGPDSINQLPALLNEKPAVAPRDTLIHHAGGGGLAIRQGDWKLIPGGTGPATKKAQRKAELFNLASDLGESRDLSEDQPERVKAMTAKLTEIRAGSR